MLTVAGTSALDFDPDLFRPRGPADDHHNPHNPGDRHSHGTTIAGEARDGTIIASHKKAGGPK